MRHWCVSALLGAALLATTQAAPASIIDDEAEGVATSSHGSDDYAWDNSLGYFRLSRPKYSVRDLGLAPRYYVDTSRFRLRPITAVRVISQQDTRIPLYRVFAEEVEEIQMSTPEPVTGQPGREADVSQPPVVSETPEAASGTAHTSDDSVVLEAEKSLDAAIFPNTPEVAADAEENANVSEFEKASVSEMPPATPKRHVEADDRSETAKVSVAIDDESAITTGEAMDRSADEGEREPGVELTNQYADVLPTREESEAGHVKDTEEDGKAEFDEVENVSVLVEHVADDGGKSMTPEGHVVEGTMEEKEVEGTMKEKETGDENVDENVEVMIDLEEVEGTMEEKEVEGTMEEKETEGANGDEDGEGLVEEKNAEGTWDDKEVEGRPTMEEKEVDSLTTTSGEGSDILTPVYESGVEERTASLLQVTPDADVQSISVHEHQGDARRESASGVGLSGGEEGTRDASDARRESASGVGLSGGEEGTRDASDARELSAPPEAGGKIESTTTTTITTTTTTTTTTTPITTTTTELEEEDKEDSTIHVAEESRQVKTLDIPIAYMCTPISISSIRSGTKSEKHPKPLVHPPIWKPVKRARYRLLQALVHKPMTEPFDRYDRYSQSIGYDAHSIF